MGFGARRINFVQKVQWHDLKRLAHTGAAGRQGSGGYGTVDTYLGTGGYGRSGMEGTVRYSTSTVTSV